MPLNFSGLSDRSGLGRLARLPLKLIPDGTMIPVLQGRLRGKRWIVGSSTHGCWLGSYEFEKQRQLIGLIQPEDTIYDIGANVGFYTLLFAHLVGSKGKVVAFEPLPNNVAYLKKHLVLNKVANAVVFEGAVADTNETVRFSLGTNPSMGHLSNNGELLVQQHCLDDLMAQIPLPAPNLMKFDIEGGEFRALLGCRTILQKHRPIVFLATHGDQVKEQCLKILAEYRYSVHVLNEGGDELLAIPISAS